jgi:hypothetical protein
MALELADGVAVSSIRFLDKRTVNLDYLVNLPRPFHPCSLASEPPANSRCRGIATGVSSRPEDLLRLPNLCRGVLGN